MEWILKNICMSIQAKVSLKTEKYTVADLYEPAKSRLIKLISDSTFKQMVTDSFRELESIGLMGNLLAHDNLDAANASISEVERFSLAVHALHVILQCPCCETFLKYYHDIKRLRCPNGRCVYPSEVTCSP